MSTKNFQLLPWIVGFLCILITSLPLFHSGFFRPHDYTHAARIVELNRSLLSGEFPVRWSDNFGFGYGMPLFNFYAPLPYYIAQVPYTLTNDAITSIKFLYVLNSILAFIGMYLFAKKYWNSKPAGTVAATVFTFATYRALDLYVRGAIGEVMAMVLLPFALYGVLQLKSNPKLGVLITSFSLAAILMTHNLSGMISILIIIVFGLVLTRSKSSVMSLLISIAGSLGLSAFYVFPAFLEKNFTRVDETITVGYFDFHNHFVALRQLVSGVWGYGGSVPGLGDGISFALGWVPIVLLVITLLTVLIFYKKVQNTKFQISKIALLLVFLMGSLFMTTNKSLLLWEHIQVLKYMQFPWRFLAFAHVFAATLAGASLLVIQKYSKLSLLAIFCVVLSTIAFNSRYFVPEKYIQDTDQYYSTDPRFIRTELSKTLNDYLPKAISDDHLPDPVVETLSPHTPSTVEVQSHKPTLTKANVNCIGVCELYVNIFQFPGWKATIDGKPADLVPQSVFPIYTLSVPSGTHDISVQLEDTPVRKIGNIVSLATLVILIAFYGRTYYYRKF